MRRVTFDGVPHRYPGSPLNRSFRDIFIARMRRPFCGLFQEPVQHQSHSRFAGLLDPDSAYESDDTEFVDYVSEPLADPDLEIEEESDEPDSFSLLSSEHDAWVAGALAHQAEEAGLIQPIDEFTWEWHQELDPHIEALQHGQSQAALIDAQVRAEMAGESNADAGHESGGESGRETGADGAGETGGDIGGSEMGGSDAGMSTGSGSSGFGGGFGGGW